MWDRTTRYGELADRYEERAAGSSATATAEEVVTQHAAVEEETAAAPDAEVATQEFAVEEAQIEEAEVAAPWPTAGEHAATEVEEPAAPEAEEVAAPATEEAATEEIDLSSEWEDAVEVEADTQEPAAAETEPAEPAAAVHVLSDEKINETIDEIRFYFAQGLPEQAWAALAKLQTLAPDDARVDQVRVELETATQNAADAEAPAEESIEELTVDDIPAAEVEEAHVAVPEATEVEVAEAEVAETEGPQAEIAEPEVAIEVEEPAVEPEPEVVQAAPEPPPVVKAAPAVKTPPAAKTPPAVKAAPAPAAAKKPAPKPAPAPEPEVEEPSPAALQEFVSDLESSLGDTFLPDAVAEPAAPPHAAKPKRAVAEPPTVGPHPVQPDTVQPDTVHPHTAHPHTVEPELVPAAHAADVVTGQQAPVLGEFVADLEASLGDDFLHGAPVAAPQTAQPAAHPAPVRPSPAPQVSAPAASAAAAPAMGRIMPPAPMPSVAAQTIDAPRPQPPVTAVVHPASPAPVLPPAPAPKASPFGEEPSVDLAEMFGELKQDLEADVASAEEDPETHYNLGIAFREMGLLDEAIGELQKACQSVERGHPFPQIMQTYTWLAQCFLDKGIPEAAIRWYEKALGVTGIDQETRTALNYELAAAHETAGDKPMALKHFMEVYGSNIDYRDVAERIKALKS